MVAYITVYGLLATAVVLWGLMTTKLIIMLRRFRALPITHKRLNELDQPSVSVCIPARDEVHALVDCLERVIASDYSKLEIIVLDDQSRDETPNLIRSFASSGVRFVEGSDLPEGWLGKNFALDTLVKEASGSLVLFMDVDTRIQPNTINDMVAYLIEQDAEMVSVLPRRNDKWRQSIFFSPLRYFWELLFHSTVNPATASNAWLIKRSVLTDTYQGLSSWKASIQPETRLAAELTQRGSYRFLISSKELGVAYEKKWRSQLSTSIRLLYPLIGRPSLVIFVLLDMLVLIAPILFVVQGLIGDWQIQHFIAATILMLFMVTYGLYTFRVWRHGALIGALLWPFLLIQEFVLLLVSVERYARNVVTWRGRPVRRQIKSDALPVLTED